MYEADDTYPNTHTLEVKISVYFLSAAATMCVSVCKCVFNDHNTVLKSSYIFHSNTVLQKFEQGRPAESRSPLL